MKKRNLCHINILVATAVALALVFGFGLVHSPHADAQTNKTTKSGTDNTIKKKKSQKSSNKNKKNSKSGTTKSKAASKKSAGKDYASLPWPQNLLSLIGDGAVLVVDHHAPRGQKKELYALNADKAYVPASILKIVTSGAALEFLGPDFRFKTDFLLTTDKDLWVVGYGDPFLVSEELNEIVKQLQKRGLKEVRNIYLDGSYFQRGLVLDGNTQTSNPYDAYNNAISVNFNTVTFAKNKKGEVSRGHRLIPLTDVAKEMAQTVKVKGKGGTYNINISHSTEKAELNSGQLIKAHMEEGGIKVSGKVFSGQTAPAKRKVFYSHKSSKTLEENLIALMEHSNNFMTNQIFLAMGAERYGSPACLEKSQKVMSEYFKKYSISPIRMSDGSGLGRQTTLTARQMADILAAMEPNRYIFSSKDYEGALVKTGTMSDIKTLAGYMHRSNNPDRPISFVILMNGKGNGGGKRKEVFNLLRNQFVQKGASIAGAQDK